MSDWIRPTRRTVMQAIPAVALGGPAAASVPRGGAEAFPLTAVRLKPSIYLDAVEANRRYLHTLEPDRLLHNFRAQAGLQPKGEIYGGWESESLAGHTLGHYLSALSLMYAQTGDEDCKSRAAYIVGELAECQNARSDGYVAGLTRKRGEIFEDGKLLFEEVRRGDIRHNSPFDMNGGWSPLYTVHKLFAGLLDADKWCGDPRAIPIALKLGAYFEGVFAGLDDAQMEDLLDCEHGGINESFAELYARTRDKRWLALAERLRHKKVLDPLTEGRDELAYLHANTQIPKVIGLARLHELTGNPRHAAAARFFWQAVTRDRSYVIGGNSDREYFQAARSTSKYITEQTCESCNSYNMLKLTRYLYADRSNAAYFDYYERTHLNHILAQHDPANGMFTYMMPLMSGTHREFSSPDNDFWCCCGTGLESHAKHGDSIYWKQGGDLFVNLFIPSSLDWKENGKTFALVSLTTGYPFSDRVKLKLDYLVKSREFTIALRIPSWCANPKVLVDGLEVLANIQDGYARVTRRWDEGHDLELVLPMVPRVEATPDDPDTIAFLHGPLVLAADLGAGDKPYDGPAPALVSSNVLNDLAAVDAERAVFRSQTMGRPGDMNLSPFFQQYQRRSAVYFRRFTDEQWAEEQKRLSAEAARAKDLDARSADAIALGDAKAEEAHKLQSKISYSVSYRGRAGRDARTGGYFEFQAATRGHAPLVLQATYWGEERKRAFNILVEGQTIARQTLDGEHMAEFIEVDYPVPAELTRGKRFITVRFEPETGHTAGPVFGCRLFTPSAG